MKLSIVATLYCSAQYIEEFCERSSKAAQELLGDDDFEIVLVNDGSPDNSLDVAVKLYESGRFPLKIVDLSRNFGHHKAMQTGCMHASGDLVYLIDVDLEEAPEWLIPFEKQLREKQQHLRNSIHTRKINFNYHDAKTSLLEAVLARGDRRLCRVLEEGSKRGFNLDSWSEHFDFDAWMDVFADCGLDPAFYANRRRPYDEILPWNHLDYGVTKKFLLRERHRAQEARVTPDCREGCAGCGANCLLKEVACDA